jgi:hypothetical protein
VRTGDWFGILCCGMIATAGAVWTLFWLGGAMACLLIEDFGAGPPPRRAQTFADQLDGALHFAGMAIPGLVIMLLMGWMIWHIKSRHLRPPADGQGFEVQPPER